MPIKSISSIRRLPRLGVIRLGRKNERGLPEALDYFLCPPEVQEVYPGKPKVLDIYFPLNDTEDIFPQFWKLYGKSAGLKAFSDEIVLMTRGENPGEWIESVSPPKEELLKQGFKPMGTLSFILPKVSYAGIYQIRTTSFNSIVNINSGLDYIKALLNKVGIPGVKLLPVKLVLEPTEAHITIKGVPARKTVYTLKLDFDLPAMVANLQKAQATLTPPPPQPKLAPVDGEINDEWLDENESN